MRHDPFTTLLVDTPHMIWTTPALGSVCAERVVVGTDCHLTEGQSYGFTPSFQLSCAGGTLRVADVEQRTAAVWECVQQIEDSRRQDGQQVVPLVIDWCYLYVGARKSCRSDSHCSFPQ